MSSNSISMGVAGTKGILSHLKGWREWEYWPLLLCLLLALLVRIWLIVHTRGVLDGDEAMTGIQAERILQGERPIYFYSQPYMGSLEAYLLAGLFLLVGPSSWALHTEPLLLSLVVVWASWRLADTLADAAQLQSRDRHYFRALVVLCAAIAPVYDAVVELRTLGGYIETFIIMLLLLDAAIRLTLCWQAGGTVRKLLWRWAWIGALIGLGFWIDPLVISAVFAVALWIAGYCLVELFAALRSKHLQKTLPRLLTGLCAGLVALPAACVGAWPALIWGATHNWENVTFLLQRNRDISLGSMHALSNLYLSCVGARVIGGALPGERVLLQILHLLPLALGAGSIVVTALLLGGSLILPRPPLIQLRGLLLLPTLFACSTYLFFLRSWGSEWCYDRDIIGRYATPVMLALPFMLAALFTCLHIWLGLRASKQSDKAEHPAGRATVWRRFALARILLTLPLLASLAAQAATYGLVNPGLTFQSPFCRDAPALNEPIIAYMQREHIHAAWSIFWVGYPIIFKTNSRIVLADPGPVLNPTAFTHFRLSQEEQVPAADRPSMLVFVAPGDAHPELLQILDKLHVTYRYAIFPSEPGVDILLATPLNRTVSLHESDEFKKVFTACPSRWGADVQDL